VIRFSVPTIATWDDKSLDDLVCHELTHCILNEAKFSVKEEYVLEEHLTTVISRALMKALERAS